VIGSSDTSLKRLLSSKHLSEENGGIDMMFLDHYKPAYTTDLKLCEELGLIHRGTVLCADNVIKPGNPPYLEYVRSSVAQKRENAKKVAATDGGGAVSGTNGHVGVDERFAARNANQYAKRVAAEKLDTSRIGNPNLVYESRLVESWEPTGVPDGVEITRCLGEET
jgi:catechol O-methyltransferase